jgi:hypothetical protein
MILNSGTIHQLNDLHILLSKTWSNYGINKFRQLIFSRIPRVTLFTSNRYWPFVSISKHDNYFLPPPRGEQNKRQSKRDISSIKLTQHLVVRLLFPINTRFYTLLKIN